MAQALTEPVEETDVMLSGRRDLAAAKAFFRSAEAMTVPDRVTTDGQDAYRRRSTPNSARAVTHRTTRHALALLV
jgi:putative transposase